jgi:hypothetical protein
MRHIGLGLTLSKPNKYTAPSISYGVTENVFSHASPLSGSNEAGTAITLGMVFHPTADGKISAIWFAKQANDTATARTVKVYNMSGTELASGTSTGEATGSAAWVKINLSSPLLVTANTKYVAAVFFPQGAYYSAGNAFNSDVVSGHIVGEDFSDASGNGRYHYGASMTYPENGGAQHQTFGIDVDYNAKVVDTGGTFPTATSVGPAAGTTYTNMSGSVHLWSGGLHSLENVNLTGNILIQMDNVTINNCIITNNDGGATDVIRIDTGITTGANLTISNCIVDGAGITTNGISGNGTIFNNKIVGVENGINMYGGNPSNISDNYIHITTTNGADPHYDGIENNGTGTSTVLIHHNTVINDNAQTSALMLNNYFDGLSNITVTNNYFEGGGYAVYVDDTKGGGTVNPATINISNNTIKTGLFGYFALYTSGVTPTNNVDAVTGTPVP